MCSLCLFQVDGFAWEVEVTPKKPLSLKSTLNGMPSLRIVLQTDELAWKRNLPSLLASLQIWMLLVSQSTAMFLVTARAESNYGEINMRSNFLLFPRMSHPKCSVSSDFCAEEKFILLNLLLAVQFLQRPRALPAFTNLKKLDKETITQAFLETLDILIYFHCSLFPRATHLWFFLIKWCESKVAARPLEQAPRDVNGSCE